ncbi:MAG: hypothetical protein P8Y60_14790, partial [Calditrichota bacterium]
LISINFHQIAIFAADEPLIVDHTCSDIKSIPPAAIKQAKMTLRIAYGHTAYGSQIIDGMSGLVQFMNKLGYENNLYAWDGQGTENALYLEDYYGDFNASGIHDLGNPDRESWVQATREYLDQNPDCNVIMWSWESQVDALETEIDHYLNLLDSLENEYPQVSFVYMTGHVDGTGTAGNVHQRNAQIRNFCLNNNKILYDFEDIESYDPDSNYFGKYFVKDTCAYDADGDGVYEGNWAIEWQNSHSENIDWYDCNAEHTQPLNPNLKAGAAWYLWARLAGWDPALSINVTDGLEGYWDFDEGSGTIVYDLSGKENNGNIFGGAEFVTDPERGTVLALDGIDDYIDLGDSYFGMEATNEFTVGIWANITGTDFQTIIQKGLYTYPFGISTKEETGYENSNFLRIYIRTEETYNGDINSTESLYRGEWYFITLTYGSGIASLYVNGRLQDETLADGMLSLASGDTYIGSRENTMYYFKGMVDNVYIYNRTLTTEEINALYYGTEPDLTPPVISQINAVPGETKAEIQWTTDEPATSVVEYGENNSYGMQTPTDTVLITSHDVTIAGLEPDTMYYYRIISCDEPGNQSISAGNTFITLPEEYTLLIEAENGVVVREPEDEMYSVGTEVSLSAVPDPGFIFNAWSGDETGAADQITVVMDADKAITAEFLPDTQPPSVPLNVTGSVISDARIDLAWDASTDNVELAGYRIYRDGQEIDVTVSTGYTDTGLAASTTYSYTVTAFDQAGNESGHSLEVNE